MTKTKEVDVHNSPTHLVFASPKERRLHLRQKMESGGGTEGSDSGQAQHAVAGQQQQNPRPETAELSAVLSAPSPGEKKKINRAPSPARPKDVPGWSLTKIRGGIGTPTLSVKPGAIHLGSRISRRSPVGSLSGKDGKAEKSGGGKPAGKSSFSAAALAKTSAAKGAKGTAGRRKVSDASIGSDDLSKDSGCAPGKLSPTDSSSELSDCASEENKLSTDAVSSDAESRSSRGGGLDGDNPLRNGASADRANQQAAAKSSSSFAEKDRLSLGVETGEGSISPGEERSVTSFDSRVPASTSLAFSDLTDEFMDGMHEEFVREIEELRSENDYLKDEMEELRSEMLEMRDMYMEEDVYQLQELRQQLEQANKTCRILQYRLRKAERRSLRVAQTGQVDGELIRTLEQDVKVAKDVSIRLHSQLDSGEKKRNRLEQENEELRVRLQDLEVAKQVLQQEIDKNSQKKRGARPNNKPDKKPGPQEDSSDLKCQLHFAKEESALMCKKLTKLAKDSEAMKEELAKFRSLYGDVNASLTVEEVADSPHTREAEVRVHLKLVEEEANLLSRRIVELEVENRGLRAEMDDMKGPQDGPPDLTGGGLGAGLGLGGGAMVLGGGASSENVMELQRHLQFVEEEAELLRRSLIEMEEQNKLLMNEINRYKSELPPPTSSLSSNSLTSLADGLLNDSPVHSIQEGAVLISTDAPSQEEELRVARLQIGELSGKVKKLQYENRVLLSNLQRCDLASYHAPSSSSSSSSLRLALETDAEAGDSAECLPTSPPHRKEPVGGENDALEIRERKKKIEDNADITTSLPGCLGQKDHDALLAMRDQARLVSTAIQLLTSPESNCLSSSPSIYHKVCSSEAAEPCDLEKPQPHSQISELSDLADRPLVGALTSRLQALHTQLQAFVEHVDTLGKSPAGGRDPQVEGASPLAPPCTSLSCSGSDLDGLNTAEEKQPDYRHQSEPEVKSETEENSQSDSNEMQNHKTGQLEQEDRETDDALSVQSGDLQARLYEVEESARGAQEELEKERQAQRGITLKLTQLQEENQKALLRRDFQLQSLGLQARLQQKLWSQERTLLVQESQHLKQALLLLSLKLRCFLKQWRLGCKKDTEWKDVLEMNSLKDLYLLLEEENLTSPAHQTDKRAAADEQPLSPTIKSSAVSSTLADLKVALQDLSGELRQERQGSQELTQQFAKAKASWEVERTELKSLITQLETKAGKAAAAAALSSTDASDPPDLKVALKREREEHQHLLAESYAAVMDLTKQLQIGERNWGREKLELLERFSQERAQWEQRLREATAQQGKSKSSGAESSADSVVANGTGSPRTKSTSDLDGPEVNGTANREEKFLVPPLLIRPELGDLTRKNWTYLTNETPEVGDTCKTWDGPSGSCSSLVGSELDLESVQRSYTAPDRTGIRIYYSPPAVRRMEHRRRNQEVREPQQALNGRSFLGLSGSGADVAAVETLEVQQQQPSSSFSSSYEQWLSSLSKQHRELLESRSGCFTSTIPSVVNNGVSGSASSVVDGMTSSSAFHGLEIGEISANLSDDMKEMTNCVRQAIRSSSLERKSSKETGSQVVGMSTRSTQTAAQYVSIGLQTDNLPSSRGAGLHSKAWSPRPSSTTTSSLASARTRQISTSLDKVHSRIERPCCSPKYGSPKLQRRVSSGSTSRLDGTSSSRDRSLWSLQQRPISGGGGSAWARSTTTRDSPVLNGLTDGLSSLFSVVEHSGSTESLWRGDGGASQGASPARHPPAAGKPSVGAVCGPESGSQRYGGLVQEFFKNVCSSRSQGGVTLPGERGAFSSVDEPKPECVPAGVGGLGALAGLGGSNDNVTRIVNKRFMRQTAGEEMVSIMGGGKETTGNAGAAGSGTEDAPCDCAAQSSCIARPSRAATRHSLSQCKHRPQESPAATEEKGDTCNE
ncbi:protein SOGA1 isoform X1 [Thunnus albacares]|uniref:protein SOGA1 isoform X1 n=2 Tax=Thunnus albacares TaxID=8236 RepID=UPI001CF61850|nr:protein SOGA1 isoform X1 [Thunnus albacares]XP_044208921.1 protein SOGA1 isoform X1 [Thunnus albacares]